MDNTVFLAAEELKLFKECTQALTRIAAVLCQGDGSVDTLPLVTRGLSQLTQLPSESCVRGTVPCVTTDGSSSPASPNSTLHSEHSTLSKADLRSFLMTKDKDAVKKLFTELSVTKFSEIPEDRYPEVMTKAQDLPDKEAA